MKYRITAYVYATNLREIFSERVSFAEIKAAFLEFTHYKNYSDIDIKITDRLVREEWGFKKVPESKRLVWELTKDEYDWILKQRYNKSIEKLLYEV
jgi:hypothetical protein